MVSKMDKVEMKGKHVRAPWTGTRMLGKAREGLQEQLELERGQHTACLMIAEGSATAEEYDGKPFWFSPSGAMVAIDKLRRDFVKLQETYEALRTSSFPPL